MRIQFTLQRIFFAISANAILCVVFRLPRFSQCDNPWSFAGIGIALLALTVLILISSKANIGTIATSVGMTVLGMFVGDLLSARSPAECVLPGAIVGWFTGCLINLLKRDSGACIHANPKDQSRCPGPAGLDARRKEGDDPQRMELPPDCRSSR